MTRDFWEGYVPEPVKPAPVQEPRCAVIVEVFGKDWRLDYMSLPVGKHKLYTQQYVYTTPPAAPVQEQQEPVAWMHTMIDDVVVGHRPADLNVHPDRWIPLYKDPTPCKTCEALARTVMMDQTAHDTTPPAAQRQWVGLTDEEWQDLSDRYGMILFGRFKNEIETKLREKNTP